MALRRAYLLMHRRADSHFAEGGLTADQFVLLHALTESANQTQRELADRIACDQNTLRAMLVLLEKRGLIVRGAHPTDRRARVVALTAEGSRLYDELWSRNTTFRQSLTAILGDDDTAVLIELLTRLARELTESKG